MKKDIETFHPKSRQEWREWLQKNYDKKTSVWLIYNMTSPKNPIQD